MSVAPDLVLLAEIQAAGLHLTLRPGGKVNAAPIERLTPELRERIVTHKPALLAALDLERRIRAMATRWQYTPADLTEVLELARQNPAKWLAAVALDERRESEFRAQGLLA